MGSRYEIHLAPPSSASNQFTEQELAAASVLAGVDVNTLTPAERLAWVEVVRAQQAAQ